MDGVIHGRWAGSEGDCLHVYRSHGFTAVKQVESRQATLLISSWRGVASMSMASAWEGPSLCRGDELYGQRHGGMAVWADGHLSEVAMLPCWLQGMVDPSL